MPESSQAPLAIGVDIGGTKCAAGLVSLSDGRVLARRLLRTEPQRGGAAVLADVIDMVHDLQQEPSGRAASAIGLAVPELVSCEGRIVSDATIRWLDMNVVDQLGSASGLPVSLEADVRAAAYGEAHFGAGREYGSFLYVTVGTGISACLVLDKCPYRGARGLAGTFASSRGFIPDDKGRIVSGPPLEQYASGPAIAARLAARRPGFTGTAREVLEMAKFTNSVAWRIVNSAGSALGAAIAQLVNVLDPQAVVLGGGLGLAEGPHRFAIEISLQLQVWSDMHRDIPLISAGLGTDAGIVGAAMIAVPTAAK